MNLDKVINIIRTLNEEVPTNNASSGAIAGLPPDQPPMKKKKKERKYIKGPGRKLWLDYFKEK